MRMILLLTAMSAALASGIGHAASLSPNPGQAGSDDAPATAIGSGRSPETEASPGGGHPNDSKARSGEPNARGAEKSRPNIHTAAARPAPLGHPPTRAQSSIASNHGSMQNEAIYRALPVRSGSVARPAVPSASPVRHRAPNPAVIGGAAMPNRRSTASLDGARMNLKSARN